MKAGFFQRLSEFFSSLFSPNSPENLRRQALRKTEQELKEAVPSFYKNSLVQPDFAETLRQLSTNLHPIQDILSDTYCSTDLDVSRHYEEQLLITGFTEEDRQVLEGMRYDVLKQKAKEAPSDIRFFEDTVQDFERVLRKMTLPDFLKIDATLNQVKQLGDICKVSYVTALKLFDANYTGDPAYIPSFQALPPELLENTLQDLYFVISDFDLTVSVYNAVVALKKLSSNGEVPERDLAKLKENFRKIQYIIKHLLTKTVLMCLIRIAKKNYEYVPNRAVYNANPGKVYMNMLRSRLSADETRIKTELKEENLENDIQKVFGNVRLTPVKGYSKDLDTQLRGATACSFLWVTPVRLVKNFLATFYEPKVKSLLNDIVVEGFFNNAAYKSDFSSRVFACNDSLARITAFEQKFLRGNEYDEANITSLIRDSHKDSSFELTLKALIDRINKAARELVQNETNNIFQLYKKVNDLLTESKKLNSDVISNLKVLMISSRNRESSEIMESQNDKWKLFLEIMKNYVTMGSIAKK